MFACSGTATGTGGPDSSGSSGTVSGSGTDSPSATEKPAPAPTFEDLFGAPVTTTATDDVVMGLWAGSAGSADIRLKLEGTSLTLAAKCYSSSAVGATVSARVSATTITILSSKGALADPNCYFDVKPRTIPKCTGSSPPTIGDECFLVSGTTLTFFGSGPVDYVGATRLGGSFSKLSD
jgi:hypothetical protein